MMNWHSLFIGVKEFNIHLIIRLTVCDVCLGNNIYGIAPFIAIMTKRNSRKFLEFAFILFFNLCFVIVWGSFYIFDSNKDNPVFVCNVNIKRLWQCRFVQTCYPLLECIKCDSQQLQVWMIRPHDKDFLVPLDDPT